MKIIPTGEMEAIDLKYLHSADVLYLDRMIETTAGPDGNGGFAKVLLEVRKAAVHVIEFTITSLRYKKSNI